MSTLVGNSRLPNVYICKIDIEDNTDYSSKAVIELRVIDILSNSNTSWMWSDDSLFSKYLRVALVSTRSTTISNQLKKGLVIPTPSHIRALPGFSENSSIDVIPISEFVRTESFSSRTYRKTITKVFSNDQKNFMLYAVCYLDLRELSKVYNTSFRGLIKDYYGSVTSEIIMINGRMMDQSFMFLRDDGTVYGGAVHYHNGVYMEGPVHTNTPHPRLNLQPSANYKLSDNRSLYITPKETVKYQNINPISDLFYTVNQSINLVGLFMLDVRRLVLHNTKYGRSFLNLGPELFREYISTVQINSIMINREQVKVFSTSDKLGTAKVGTKRQGRPITITTTTETAANELKETKNLKQVFLDEGVYVRSYQFIDDTKNIHSAGNFSYNVDITFKDKSKEFIDSKFSALKKSMVNLKNIINFLNKKSSFDYNETKMLKPQITVPQGIVDCIRTYYKFYRYVADFSETENQLVSNRVNLFTPGTYKPKYGNNLVQDMSKLISLFSSKFDLRNKYSRQSPKTIKVNKRPGMINLKRKFSPIVNFREYHRNYDYFPNLEQEQNGILTMGLEDLQDRAQLENDRFFMDNYNLSGEEFQGMDEEVKRALEDLETSSMTYFSPLFFNVSGESIPLEDVSTANYSKINEGFYKARDLQIRRVGLSSPTVPKRPKKRGRNVSKSKRLSSKRVMKRAQRSWASLPKLPTFTIKALKSEKTKLYAETVTHHSSSDYLGTQSSFTNAPSSLDVPIKEVEVKEISSTIKTAMQVATGRSKNDFDMDSENNYLDNFINSKKFNPTRLSKTPNQFKALVTSRAAGVRNSLLEDDDDLLSNPDTKITSEIMLQTIQEIQVLVDYEKDSYGENILSKPIFMTLEQGMLNAGSTAICRLVYLQKPEIGMEPSSQFILPVLNSLFIISGDDLTINRQDVYTPKATEEMIRMSEANRISRGSMYGTSNIVKQRNPANPITRTSTATRLGTGRAQGMSTTVSTNASPSMSPTSGGGMSGGNTGGGMGGGSTGGSGGGY